jgi:hypothetical protein|tara:strand:- start:496 stop:681 length:186 start_codon:yes stop_codon:yes gene_type:complete
MIHVDVYLKLYEECNRIRDALDLELKDVIDDETLEVFLNKVERLKGKYVKLKTMEDEDGMV